MRASRTIESAVPFQAGTPLPAVLVLIDLAALLQMSITQARLYERAGEFLRFELLPRIGKSPRYSGARLQAWIEQAPESRPASHHWGRKRAGSLR